MCIYFHCAEILPIYEDPIIAISGIYFNNSFPFFFLLYSIIFFPLFDFMLPVLNILYSLSASVNKLKGKK